METTMIQVKKETAKALKEIKQYSKQSYDEIIRILINVSKAESLTEKERKNVEEALMDVKQGKIYRIEDLADEFKIRLKN